MISRIYNIILIYIILIAIILIIKPEFMYCTKTNKFKSFGMNDNQTLFCFFTVSIMIIVVLFIIFISIEILYDKLDS